MTAMSDRPIRVIQWTTGNIGRRSLHAIIGRPDMDLVGVYAHGPDKVGVDAAELAGWPQPTGIAATDDIDALIAAKPDACCYNPLWPSIDELERLLEAGVNVCTSAAWITGGKQRPSDLERIRKACERGDSTIFGSGAHPGMTNMVGMVLSGSCERVDEIRITESVDCSTYESAGTQIAMGFSQDPQTPGLAESVRRESEVFAESAAMMADAIGAELDRMTFDVTFTPATGDSDLGFMTIPEGTVAGVYGYHRPRDSGGRRAEHADRAALPAAQGLGRTRFHGARDDLHRHAGDQRDTGCGGRTAGDRHAEGSAAGHRQVRCLLRPNRQQRPSELQADSEVWRVGMRHDKNSIFPDCCCRSPARRGRVPRGGSRLGTGRAVATGHQGIARHLAPRRACLFGSVASRFQARHPGTPPLRR
jgi:4-hydroxy-tetrahydrodipicolinate reductase